MPPTYIVSLISIHDPQTYKKYTALTPATLERYGARFLTRGGDITTLEGEPYTDRMVVIEFPSKEAVEQWYRDPEYVEAMKYRHASSTARVLVQEGPEVEGGKAPEAKV